MADSFFLISCLGNFIGKFNECLSLIMSSARFTVQNITDYLHCQFIGVKRIIFNKSVIYVSPFGNRVSRPFWWI